MIREEVSKKLGIPIGVNSWASTFDNLDVAGKLTQRSIKDILVVILIKLEELEKK